MTDSSSSKKEPYLFQGGVRHAKTAQAHVRERLLQLPEEAGIGPVFEVLVWKQVDHLLANQLKELGVRNVVVDQASYAVHVAWGDGRRREQTG